jgi:protein-tyrosine-phosphatase
VRSTIIQFICTGNIYRSRLAEAYCASKQIPGVRVLSTGVAAGKNGDASISPYAADVLTRYGINSYAAKSWQRTTAALVRASDVLVFMEPEHQRFCETWIEPGRHQVEVWGIEDIGPIDAARIPDEVERTFSMIRQRTDVLLAELGLR